MQRCKCGISGFEEWLQQEYVNNYDNILDNENKIEFMNRIFDYTLLLKDGSRSYIINEGKIYYLLDKSCSYIPNEIKQGLTGGDNREYSKYTRLQDVYGITRDLKVYYCGEDAVTQYGNIENYDINPNASSSGINGNSGLKSLIIDEMASRYSVTVDNENGVTLANTLLFNKDLEVDGTKYTGITDISGLGDLKSLKELTLSNLNLTSLSGLEGIPNLRYLYLKNTTVEDYGRLASCLNLQYLYIYLPSSISENVANNQVIGLGEGLRNASGLKKLQFFGISR